MQDAHVVKIIFAWVSKYFTFARLLSSLNEEIMHLGAKAKCVWECYVRL